MYRDYKTNNMAASQQQQAADHDELQHLQKLQKMFGDKLQGKDATVDVKTLFGPNKIIGIYFSAHWCPPCRGFTPMLAEFYKRMKPNHPNFEIVFASSDRDANSFNDYFKEMPWLAVPYEKRDLKAALSKKFKVNGIPTFVILDGETGKTITTNGRSKVDDDPEGKEFPWHEKPFSEIVAGKVINKKGEESDITEAMKGKVTGFYFSAHWCPPCKSFTPKLVETYKKLKEDGKNFEVIFVSSDRDEKSFQEYLDDMPWLALPFGVDGDERISHLNERFEIEGIPALFIVDENGKVINDDGRGAVTDDSKGEEFPWRPKPVNKLTGNSAGKLNTEPCLVLFTGDSKEDTEKAQEELKEVGEVEISKEEQELHCFTAATGDELTKKLAEFANLDTTCQHLAIFNIAENTKYICPESNVTKQVVNDFVSDYREGKLKGDNIKM